MITKIHSTTVVVSDQDAALDFYVNTLGWEKRLDQQVGPDYRFLTVAPAGGEAELVLGPPHIHALAPGVGLVRGDGNMGSQTGISFSVENIDETYRTLVERGVRFTQPPTVMPWGDKATWMLDPDGNSFFLVGA